MSESENFNKIVVLISKGGEMIGRQLLEKYSSPLSFSDYLFNNQGSILTKTFAKDLMSQPQLDMIIHRNIDEMDVSLLYKLAFHLFKTNMTADEARYLKEIKDERNKLLHSDALKKAKIKEADFNTKFGNLSVLLKSAAKEVGNTAFENNITEFIDRIESSSSLLAELYDELQRACNSNNEEIVKALQRTMMNAMAGIIGDKAAKRKLACIIDKFQASFEAFISGNVSETSQITSALECLQEANVVTLVGRAGEGKTTTAFQLVKKLCENGEIKLERCAMLIDPKDVKHLHSREVDLILIDDMFGKHSVEGLAGWEKCFDTLVSFTRSRNIKVISCSRKHILTELLDKLAGVPLFSEQVELDSAELTKDEKRNILKAKLLEHNKDMDEKEIEKCIDQTESNAGFPSIAAKFAADDTLFTLGFNFFAEPISYYLEQNIRNMDIYSWAALVCLKQNGNQLTLDKLTSTDGCLARLARRIGIKEEPVTLAQNIWKRYKYLDGTFVRICEDSIIFLFDTVSNAIAEIFQDDHDMSSSVEEATEATESNVQNMVMSNTQAGRQKPQNKERIETHAVKQEPKPRENPIVRFFKWLWRKISSLWNKKKEKGNDRGPRDVETGTNNSSLCENTHNSHPK